MCSEEWNTVPLLHGESIAISKEGVNRELAHSSMQVV